ncbi:hypothetical protein Q3A66_04390 [Hymenobacter sp. BT770]|uniref:hypothetical protein n=1 Tax=Hymenobacter sp. BT770 TaxID=2886942 RepID=UPI001D1237F4|nr:hypothetical protein [Hymenobacter sp. BT770]MCC3153300.1 hypothetical protein [Hymenobacter sp. BT770]MDO3414295.1 hypothetical protein [Hymenobacter sp. BT770]
MENEETNLNTEPNDIAGNRIDGPVGNTAAKHTLPNAGVGIPGGPPTPPSAAPGSGSGAASPEIPPSSEELADAELSVAEGALGDENEKEENRPANPDDLTPLGAYGGNFSNSTQDSYHDQSRRDNQDSDPNRGEFGAQDLGGTTHGGFGNQNRLADYEPHNTPEDRYYGGPGRPGHQDNAYRAYDGRDERPDPRHEYGFERGTTAANTSGATADPGHLQGERYNGPNADNRNQPNRADVNSAYQNDNGSAPIRDSGFAEDYGHTSLRGEAAAGVVAPASASTTSADRRNQTEDYLPAQAGFDKQGHREEQHPGYSTNDPEVADQRGQRPASSLGYGDRGREEPRQSPDFRTGDDRNGYVQANGGDSAQGHGSRGGSYNDAYDDSRPGSKAGSPAQGEQRAEDRDANFGSAAREENRSNSGDDNAADHGAPRRNAGRDGEADE